MRYRLPMTLGKNLARLSATLGLALILMSALSGAEESQEYKPVSLHVGGLSLANTAALLRNFTPAGWVARTDALSYISADRACVAHVNPLPGDIGVSVEPVNNKARKHCKALAPDFNRAIYSRLAGNAAPNLPGPQASPPAEKSPENGQVDNARREAIQALGNMRGRNFRAVKSLPVWIRSNGNAEFPSGKNLAPNQIGTITEILACSEYPVHEGVDCRFGVGGIIALLFNGATPRPAMPPKPKPNSTAEDILSRLDDVTSTFGGILDRMEVEQRRTRRDREHQTDEAARQKGIESFNNAGPELIIWLDAFGSVGDDGGYRIDHGALRHKLSEFIIPETPTGVVR